MCEMCWREKILNLVNDPIMIMIAKTEFLIRDVGKSLANNIYFLNVLFNSMNV